MDINAYLRRMGIEHVGNIRLETLRKLQYYHMTHIPFENLDVMRGVPIVLDIDSFYQKIVKRQRGGYCYENNGLFHALLNALGFQCRLVSGTIYRPDGTWARRGSHACTVVTLDGKEYLTDVGFGDSARGPLPLTGEVHQDVSGFYCMKKVEEGIYDIERMQADENDWNTIIRIDTTPMKLADFADANEFNQTSDKSPFTQKDIVTIATTNGRVTLSGQKLTTTEKGEKHETTISETEKKDVLERYFQITGVTT